MQKNTLFIVFLFPFLLSAQISDTTQARMYLERADSLVIAANQEEALQQVAQSIAIYEASASQPESLAAAYSLQANVYLEMGQLEVAQQIFEKALAFCQQTFDTQHIATAQAYNDIGNYEQEQGNLGQALDYFRTSLRIRASVLPSSHPDIADSYNNLGNIGLLNAQYEVAERHYKQALALRRATLGEEHIDVASSYFNLGNCAFHQLRLQQAFEWYQQSLQIRTSVLGKQHPACAKNLLMLGRCLEANGNWSEAIQYYTQSKAIFDAFPSGNSSNQAYANDYIGSSYAKLGRNRQALPYHQLALAIREKIYPASHPILGESWNNIGNAYFHLGDFARAMQYYQQAIVNLEGSQQARLAATYENLGICYRYQKKYQESLQYLSKALVHKTPNSHQAASTYINIGNVYSDVRQYAQARHYYQESMNLLESTSNADLIRATNNIGICYFEEGAFSDALPYFEQALELANVAYGKDAIPSITYLKNVALTERELGDSESALQKLDRAIGILNAENTSDWSKVEAPLELLSVLEAKGELLYENYTPDAAIETYEKALNLLYFLRLFFQNNLSKQKLNEYNVNLFEKTLLAYFSIVEKKGIASVANPIFSILEKGKSLLLLEALLKSEATQLAGIPDSLIEQEQQLLKQIGELEQSRYQAQSSETTALNAEIASFKQAHTALISTLEQDYPDYYALKYQPEVVALESVQTMLLQDGQSMLEYFVGEQAIFVLLIQKDKVDFFRIPKDFPLEKWVFNIHDAVSNYFVSGKASAAIYNEVYITFAQQLYERLFPDTMRAHLSEKLIIIPDGALGYLPFDLLLTKTPKDSTRFKHFDYLLKQHQISYAYSAALLHKTSTSREKRAKKQLLAVAPHFKHEGLQLKPLNHNQKEVNALSDIFRAKVLTDTTATSTNFLAHAPDYRILHLATHGLADNRAGQFSYIAFSNDSTATENDLLYVHELYNTQLQADMVVLSACETALGEFQQGEGIISLARGFSYAGAKSVITTLWSIDDKNTSKLMQLFYQHLHAGATKDAALRQAKLDLMETGTHELAHPYYWAAFIPIGEMSGVTASGRWWWLGIGIISLLSFFLLRQRFQKVRK